MLLFVDIVVQTRKDIYVCVWRVLRVWGYLCFVAMKNPGSNEGTPRGPPGYNRIDTKRRSCPHALTPHTQTPMDSLILLLAVIVFGVYSAPLLHVPYTKQHMHKVEERKRIDKLNRHSYHNPLQQSLVRAHLLASSPHSEHV